MCLGFPPETVWFHRRAVKKIKGVSIWCLRQNQCSAHAIFLPTLEKVNNMLFEVFSLLASQVATEDVDSESALLFF